MLQTPDTDRCRRTALGAEESAALPGPAQGRAVADRRAPGAPRCRRPRHPNRARAQMAFPDGGVDRIAAGCARRSGPHRRDRRSRRNDDRDPAAPADGWQSAGPAAPRMVAAAAHPAADVHQTAHPALRRAHGRGRAVRGRCWRDGASVDLDTECRTLTLRALGRSVLGMDLDARADAIGQALRPAVSWIADRGTRPVNLPQWVPTPCQQRARRGNTTLHQLAAEILAAVRKDPDRDAPLVVH